MSDKIQIELEQLLPVMLEQLKAGGKFKFSPKGTSMLPLIHQGVDEVVISPKKGELKKYDVPFYRRKDGQFVLHRIVGRNKDGYILCGDNQYIKEYGVTDDMIIGVLAEVHTPDKVIKVTDRDYISYAKKRVFRQKLRGKAVKLRAIARKIVKGK